MFLLFNKQLWNSINLWFRQRFNPKMNMILSEVDDVGDNIGKDTLVSFLIRKVQRSTVLEWVGLLLVFYYIILYYIFSSRFIPNGPNLIYIIFGSKTNVKTCKLVASWIHEDVSISKLYYTASISWILWDSDICPRLLAI